MWDKTLLEEIVGGLTEDLIQNMASDEKNYKSSVATAFFFKFFNKISAELVMMIYNSVQHRLSY